MNQQVLVFNELWTPNEIWSKLEELSGEKLNRKYESQEVLEQRIADGKAKLAGGGPLDYTTLLMIVASQYQISWGIRGDNTPEYAKYLGYLTSKDLYPDMKVITFDEYLREVVSGKAKGVYSEMKAQLQEAIKNAKS